MDAPKIRIALIAGGTSGEREVSLKGAAAVEQNLDPAKFQVERFDPATDLAQLVAKAKEIDFAFILLHGPKGEDGTVQGLLDLLDVPYQGSGVVGSAIAMDKHLSKELYRMNGLPVAEWEVILPKQKYESKEIIQKLGLPVVVKPCRDGSSLGLTIAHSEEELKAGIALAMGSGREVMVEQYIPGRELTAGILGNDTLEALPLVEIIPGKEYQFFDYTAKYKPGASEEICPAQVSDEIKIQAQEYAKKAHQALRLRGYSRTDLRLDPQNRLFLLETNTIPGMTSTSLLPQAAAAYGLKFPQFLERLVELGMQ